MSVRLSATSDSFCQNESHIVYNKNNSEKHFSFIIGISAQLAIFEFVKYTHGLIYHRNYVGGHTVNYGPSSCFVIFSLKSFLDRKQVTILNNVASAPRKVIAAWLGIIVKYVDDNCIV